MRPAEGICAARGTILHKSCRSQAAVIFFGERYDFARPFFFFREHLDFGTKIGILQTDSKGRPFFFFLENTLILGQK